MGNLFQELKRRKVIRVAGVYAVVAWLLIQVADTVLPALQMPEWTVSFVTILFILGFPIAVILSWAYEVTPEGISSDPGVQAQAQVPAPQSQRLIYAIFVLVLLVAGFQFSDRFFSSDANSAIRSAESGSVPVSPSVVRSSIILNQSLPPLPGYGIRTLLSLAPDDSRLAYTDPLNGRLLLRDLATQETQEIVVGTSWPTFSPNSQNLLVYLDTTQQYNIMPAQGGGLRPLPIEADVRGSWFSDGEILYKHADGGFRIFSLADETDELVPNFGTEDGSGWLFLLPQRAAFLFQKSSILRQQNQLEIQIYDLDSQSTTLVTNDGYKAQYVKSGHVLFIRRGDLWAVPFDLDALEVAGPEARVLEGVDSEPILTTAAYSVSDSGRLVYLPGREYFSNQTVLDWVDRSGNREEIPLPTGHYAEPRISPDGELLALTSSQADGSTNIWVYEFATGAFGPKTFSGTVSNPVWNANGSRLFYQETSVVDPGGLSRGEIWVVNANGTGQAERLLDAAVRMSSFSQLDEKIIYTTFAGDRRLGQLNTLTFSDGVWVSAPLLTTDFSTTGGTVSPDGRWIVYTSNESGSFQIYVRPYPNLDGGKWVVSSKDPGNVQPTWGPNSDELFFLSLVDGTGTLMHTEITVEGDRFSPGIVEPLVTDLQVDFNTSRVYSVSNDGERFLLSSRVTVDVPDTGLDQNRTELVMVENFFEELKRLAPPNSQ